MLQNGIKNKVLNVWSIILMLIFFTFILLSFGIYFSIFKTSNTISDIQNDSNNLYKKLIELYPNEKIAFLTFDDGPNISVTPKVLDILKEDQECMLVVSGDKHAYISKNFENKKDFISLFMKNVQFVESYDDIEDDILKFSIASFDDQMEQRIEKIQKQLKPHLKLVTTGNVWFDIFYKDVNKGTTLTHLLEILKIKPEESGAFGDQMNDYEMLQTVKYGYAMANAMPPVKEVAYQVIDSNENDGVILKIKEILKGKC